MEDINGQSLSSGSTGSSGDHSVSGGIPLDLFDSDTVSPAIDLNVPAPNYTPVENSESPFTDFDFSPIFKENVEEDEEGESFTTYAEDRSFQRDVVSFIERFYYDKGDLPEYRLLHETFSDYPECPRYIKGWKEVVDAISEKLDARGLPGFRTAEGYLDPIFVSLCNEIMNPHDKRSDAAKIKDYSKYGVTPAKWNAWLQRKRYREYYQARADRIFDEEIATEAKRRLGDLVRSGDLAGIKYFEERTGIYRSGGDQTALVGAVIQAIMSILARNVEPSLMTKIGSELRSEPAILALMQANAIEAKAS